jgi:hypothetical protein
MPYVFRSKLDDSSLKNPVNQSILLVDFDYRGSLIVRGVKIFKPQKIKSSGSDNFMLCKR